jgi:hypothetical protein
MIKVACIHPQSITLLEAANQLTYTPSSKDQWYVFDPVHLYELQLSTLRALRIAQQHIRHESHDLTHPCQFTATYTNTHVSINTDSSECVTRGLCVLREQLFLMLLLTTCRASEYTLRLRELPRYVEAKLTLLKLDQVADSKT